MNKKFYKKIRIALTVSILCFTNWAFSQGSERAGQSVQGLSSTRYVLEGQSNLRSDVKPTSRPILPKVVNAPKGVHSKPLSVPSNDECATASFLSVGVSCMNQNFDQSGATESMPADMCSGYTSLNAEDVWFEFIASSPNQTIEVTESASFDAVLELFDGCGGNIIDCSDNTWGGGHAEKIMANGLTPGNSYFVRVYYYGSIAPLTTTFDICVVETPPAPPTPANDECTGAFSINVAANEAACSPTTVNTASSTQSSPNPWCASISNDDDVYYKFVAPYKSIIAKASNLGAGVTGVGFVLYSDSCKGAESLECTIMATNDRQDFANLIPGHTYYLRTFTSGAGSGTFDLCLLVPPPPPANDECTGAISITPAANHGACSPIGVNTVSSTHSLPDPTCASTSNDDDVWYKFVANDSTMTAEATNFGSTVFGVGFVLYEGSCTGTQSIECTTYATNNKQSFQKLKIGTTYYLRTFTSGAGGTFDLCVYRTPPPANDECSNAISITANGSSCSSIQGDVDGAYQSLPPVNCNGASSFIAIDVWYKFIAASTKQTILVSGSKSFDPVVEILDGCNGVSLYCSDKNYGYGTIETIKDTTCTIGKTYYVRVYNNGSNPATTNFDICIFKTPNAPVNDNCGGAIKINPTASGNICTATTVNTVSATQSAPNPTCASYDNDDDVWYYFTANDTTMTVRSMNYSAGITGAGFVLYADSCGGLQSTECNYNAPSGAQTFKKLVKGKTYLLRTFTYMANATGTYDICVFAGLPISKNDECVNAIPIGVNSSCTSTVGDVLGATQSLTPINCGTGQSLAANDVWFSFVADQDNATVKVSGSSSFDAIEEMFDGCGGSSVACSDKTYSGGVETIVNASVTKGKTYYVRVYSYGSSMPYTSTFDICVTSKLSVGISNSNAAGKSLSVFPNPAQNDLNIRFVSPSENSLSMKMYNAAGQVVYTFTSGQFSNEFNKQIPVEGLAKGFYLLQVVTSSGVYNQKVLID